MTEFYIDPSKVTLELDAGEGYPQLGVSVNDMFVTEGFRTIGLMEDCDAEQEYGIPDDFARAMGIVNMWLKRWYEEGNLSGRRYVCAWSSDGYGDEGPTDVGIDFFYGGNGYPRHAIEAIKALELGGVYANHDHGINSHIVYRRK